MKLDYFNENKGSLRCKNCDSQSLSFVKGEIRCGSCGKWFDWVKRPIEDCTGDRAPLPDVTNGHVWGKPPDKEKPPRYTPNQVAHPQTLEERVASLEHDLSILAQIVMGKK